MSALNTKCDCCGDYRPTTEITRNLRPLRNARQTEGGFSDRPAAEADNTRLIVLGLVGLGLFFMMVAVWADLFKEAFGSGHHRDFGTSNAITRAVSADDQGRSQYAAADFHPSMSR